MDLNIIYNIVSSSISFTIIVLVIAIGEIVKRYWKSNNINAFFKVLIPTLPLTILYAYLSKISQDVVLLSYLLAFWLYPFLVKPLLVFLGLKKTRVKRFKPEVGGELPDDDDEQ